jgi:hypothetical protein
MVSQPSNSAARSESGKVAEAARRCPTDWQLAQDDQGTFYCAPPDPDAATGELLGHWLGISIVIVVVAWLLLRARRRR